MASNFIKTIFLLVALICSSIALARDWRVVAIQESNKTNVDVNYDSIKVQNGLLVFDLRYLPDNDGKLNYPNAVYLYARFAISCTENTSRLLMTAKSDKNGQSKILSAEDVSKVSPDAIDKQTILGIATQKLCSEYKNLLSPTTIKSVGVETQSKLLPSGLNSINWRFVAKNQDHTYKFWINTDSIQSYQKGVASVLGKFEYQTFQSLPSGNKFITSLKLTYFNCNLHTEDTGGDEFYDNNGKMVESSYVDDSEIDPNIIEKGTIASAAYDITCPIALSNSQISNTTPSDTTISKDNPSAQATSSLATGTAWQISNTYLVTSNHVIAGANSIAIMVNANDIRTAEVVSNDISNDIAIIKIQGVPLTTPPLTLAPKQSKLGSKVSIIGFPHPDILGPKIQASSGEISGFGGISNDPRYYQISAPVQLGNSGGPLLNQQGEVIGLVSSKLNELNMLKERGELPQNINFAIKSSYIQALIDSTEISLAKSVKKSGKIEDAISQDKNSVFLIITSSPKK